MGIDSYRQTQTQILRRLLGQRGEPFLVLPFGQAVAVGSHSQR